MAGTTSAAYVTSGSDGTFEFWVDRFDYDESQKFKVVLSKTGYASATWDNVIVDQVVLGTYSITADKTVSTTISVPDGVIYSVATGKTLTFSGPFSAGTYQVFSLTGTGAVVFGEKTRTVPPEWFGAAGDYTTDDGAAIRAAYAALTKGTLILSDAYLIDSGDTNAGLTLVDGKFIKGVGQTTAKLKAGANLGAKPLLYMVAGASGQHVQLADFYAEMAAGATATDAIHLDTSQSSIIDNVKIYSFTNGSGIKLSASTAHTAYFNQIRNPYIYNCVNGIELAGTAATNAPNSTSVYGGEVVAGATSAIGIKMTGAAGAGALNGCYFNGTDVEGSFSTATISLENATGNTFDIRTETTTGYQTLKLAGTSTKSNNSFRFFEANQTGYSDGTTSFSKAQVVSAVSGIVTAANIKLLLVFDPNDTATTETDRSTVGGTTAHVVTYRTADPTAAVAPATSAPHAAGLATYFTGSASRLWNTPDAADLTFGDGSNDTAFSIVTLASNNNTNGTLVAKYDETTVSTQREYFFGFDGAKLKMVCYDNSAAGASIGRSYNTSLASDWGTWHTYAATKSTGVTSAAIKVFRDGVAIDDTNVEAGSYTAMEDKTALVGSYYLSSASAVTYPFIGRVSVMLIVAEELTASQVARLDAVLRGYAGVY